MHIVVKTRSMGHNVVKTRGQWVTLFNKIVTFSLHKTLHPNSGCNQQHSVNKFESTLPKIFTELSHIFLFVMLTTSIYLSPVAP